MWRACTTPRNAPIPSNGYLHTVLDVNLQPESPNLALFNPPCLRNHIPMQYRLSTSWGSNGACPSCASRILPPVPLGAGESTSSLRVTPSNHLAPICHSTTYNPTLLKHPPRGNSRAMGGLRPAFPCNLTSSDICGLPHQTLSIHEATTNPRNH